MHPWIATSTMSHGVSFVIDNKVVFDLLCDWQLSVCFLCNMQDLSYLQLRFLNLNKLRPLAAAYCILTLSYWTPALYNIRFL